MFYTKGGPGSKRLECDFCGKAEFPACAHYKKTVTEARTSGYRGSASTRRHTASEQVGYSVITYL